jgi:hypothetical protein
MNLSSWTVNNSPVRVPPVNVVERGHRITEEQFALFIVKSSQPNKIFVRTKLLWMEGRSELISPPSRFQPS